MKNFHHANEKKRPRINIQRGHFQPFNRFSTYIYPECVENKGSTDNILCK